MISTLNLSVEKSLAASRGENFKGVLKSELNSLATPITDIWSPLFAVGATSIIVSFSKPKTSSTFSPILTSGNILFKIKIPSSS